MKENIGGYFELESLVNNPYHKNAIQLNSARNALLYVIKSKKIKKIYTPYYMCDSIDFISNYCQREYYDIDDKFLPMLNKKMSEDEYIYVVNYFGIIDNELILKLKEKYINIIIDNVQAFFQKPVNTVDTIYSCRKFLGVTDGAYLYTNNILNETLKNDESKDRYEYVLGRLETSPQEHFEEYRKNEELLNKLELMNMSKTTKTLLGAFDYEKIKNARTINFKYLNNNLMNINKLKLKNIEGAFAYPLYINDATILRKELIKNNVFIPTLWPNVISDNKSKKACDLAKNILVLPCDQRYTVDEMNKIIKIIKEKI